MLQWIYAYTYTSRPMEQIPGSGIAASASNFHRYCQIISINIAPFYIPSKIYKSAFSLPSSTQCMCKHFNLS